MADQWTVEIDEHHSPYEWFGAAIWADGPDGLPRLVARVPQAEPHWDAAAQARTLAEARVLSAAPELLAALTHAVNSMESALHRMLTDHSDCWICEARAAIAKALGKEASRGK